MTQRLEHFIYAHPDGPITLQVSEDNVTFYDMTLTETLVFSDALTEWASQATAHGTLTGTYAFSIGSSGQVRLVCSTTAYYKGPAGLHEILGFSSEVMGSGVLVDGDTEPMGMLDNGRADFEGCGYALAQHSEDLKIEELRLGRSLALSHSLAQTVDWWCVMSRTLWTAYTAGPLFRGKLRLIHSATSGTYGPGTTTAPIDIYPFGKVKITEVGKTGTYVRVSGKGTIADVTGTDTEPAVPTAGTFEELARGWSYGWGVIYAAKVEGIANNSGEGLIFTEVPTGASSPSNYAQVAGLVIDNSARIGSMINRREGLGAGFDLTLTFLDGGTGATDPLRQSEADASTIRDLFKAPTAVTRLTADLSQSAITVTVEDTTDFDTTGTVFLGKEAIYHVSKSATTFSLCVRGAPTGGEFRSYEHSSASSVGAYISNTPHIWRGREVKLYAIPVNPLGDVTGANVMSDAILVWRGFVADHPMRARGTWQVPCKPYDRKLSEPLGGAVSGAAKWDFGVDYPVAVDAEAAYELRIRTHDSWGTDVVTANVTPFSAYTTGDTISCTVWRQTFADAIEAAFPGLGWSTTNQPGNLYCTWQKVSAETGGFEIALLLSAQPGENGQKIGCWVSQIGGWQNMPPGLQETSSQYGNYLPFELLTGEICDSTSESYTIPTGVSWSAKGAYYLLQFQPDDGNTADIPTSGHVIIEGDGATSVHRYTDAIIDDSGQGTAKVTLVLAPGEQPGVEFFQVADGESGATAEVSVRIAYRDAGLAVDVLRRMLATSGRTGAYKNDATYDSGDMRQGYDLEHVDHTNIGEVLGPVWDQLSMDLLADTDTSFGATFGPVMGLCNHALVTRWTGSDRQIRAVSTGPADTGYYVASIGDGDLVSSGSRAPVKILRDAHPRPNRVRLTIERIEDDTNWSLTVNDVQAQRQHGEESWEVTSRGFSRGDLAPLVLSWCNVLLGLGIARAQIIEIQVHPGIPCEPGDLVRLDLSHYDLWTYSTASPGYSGPARVIGTQLDLSTGVKTVRCLIDGVHRTMALCPSEQITAIGAGTPPAYVEIRQEAYNQFAQWFTRDGAYDVQVYLPGSDSNTERWTISAVTDTGSATRLTISAETGTFTATTSWFVTVPETAQASTAQLEHAHTDTTGVWL